MHELKKQNSDAILSKRNGRMATTDTRKEWEHKTRKSYAIVCSRLSEQPMMEWLEEKKPFQPYVKGLIAEDMDTERTWRICMGVATGAEYAKRYGWEPLHTQLWKLAVELGAKLGLDPGEVYRQSHQVQESERLY